MALETLFFDGFDHYATADLLTKWDGGNSTGIFTVDSTIARTGGKSLKRTSSSDGAYITRSLGMNARTLVVGIAVYFDAYPSTSNSMLALYVDGAAQISLTPGSGGSIDIRRGSYSGTLLGTSSALPVQQWSYIELRVYIDDTAGEWEFRINGATDISGSGVDTKTNASLNYANQIRLQGFGSINYSDDLYVRGATDLQAGGFLGDSKVLTVLPNAAGSSTQLTPTGAASNHEAVDETTPDGDTSYVSGNTGKDLYAFADITAATIHAAQLSVMAKKSDAGARSIAPTVKSGATEDAGANQALSTDYRYKQKVWEVNPDTAAAWSAAEINSAEFGASVGS